MLIIALLLRGLLHAADCPGDMVEFGTFCMDRFEAPNRAGERPLTGKTALEGEIYCETQGKELCDEEQWMHACSGADGARAFPYGTSYERGRCNDDKTWIAPDWAALTPLPSERADAEIARLNQSDASGSRAGCATPEGVGDLTGNVAEWVKATRPHPNSHSHVLKGCYWAGCFGGEPPGCGFVNSAHPGRFRTYEAGFRCCAKRGASF